MCIRYVAVSASSAEFFPYVYSFDISGGSPEEIWQQQLETAGAEITGTPFVS